MSAKMLLLLGVGLVVAGRIISKVNAVQALNYKLTKLQVKKVPLYEYLRGIPLKLTFQIDNMTDERLPFKGFEGAASMEGISPVPFRVVGSGEVPAQASTEINADVNVTSAALLDAIVNALAGRIPKIVNVKGNLYLGKNPLKVDTDINLLEYI